MREALFLVKQILRQSSRLKTEGRVDTEAEQLLVSSYQSTTGIRLSRLELFAQMDSQGKGCYSFSKSAIDKLIQLAHERVRGIPLQYLIGSQWFRDHEYDVDPAVLIPRPETEVLLDLAIKELNEALISPELGLEVGLGSGILSIELLSYFSNLRMISSELTDAASKVARRNANKILGNLPGGGERLTLVHPESASEVMEVFERQLAPRGAHLAADFIVSNPPYLADQSEAETEVSLYEPHEALFAPQGDPLYFYKNILAKGREFLKPLGFVFLEVPHERSHLILQQFLEDGWFTKILPDLTGRDRVLIARLIPFGRHIHG